MRTHVRHVLRHRHGPFAVAAVAALIVAVPAMVRFPGLGIDIPNIVFYIVYVAAVISHFPSMTGEDLRKRAAEEDPPAPVIIVITILTVIVAFLALFNVLHHRSDAGAVKLALAFASVVAGWATIHMMAAIHYAHIYWSPEAGRTTVRGGLEFPGISAPCGFDFISFSFGIGMTTQAGDIAITSSYMRRRNLPHAIFSFFFNTVLLAAAVSGAVALFG